MHKNRSSQKNSSILPTQRRISFGTDVVVPYRYLVQGHHLASVIVPVELVAKPHKPMVQYHSAIFLEVLERLRLDALRGETKPSDVRVQPPIRGLEAKCSSNKISERTDGDKSEILQRNYYYTSPIHQSAPAHSFSAASAYQPLLSYQLRRHPHPARPLVRISRLSRDGHIPPGLSAP